MMTQAPMIVGNRLVCPRCGKSRRRGRRALARHRRHWQRKHAERKQPHDSVIPWIA